ncbi:hypothetical protein [Dubosiella newyorkensis]|uniref:hypothetical protein n=1 Tax=Dubosiella newyorkensis TaxID=1862672 RepID=UPI003F66A548
MRIVRARVLLRYSNILSDILSGIPSYVYGLCGMLFFVNFSIYRTSILAERFTLVIYEYSDDHENDGAKVEDCAKFYREGVGH